MTDEDVIFTAPEEYLLQYKKQLSAFLESGSSKSALIDMGPLPKIYTALGIPDKELKTNGRTILKALGLKGKHHHNVPQKTLEDLLSLAYNPEAVFKSLPTSKNPNSYVLVLDAKNENQKQIIAVLSPSRFEQGYTFIPSVYEKDNFYNLFNKSYSENRVLYIKNQGSELWGRAQCPPLHNSEPLPNNILTKTDIVKRILKPASYEADKKILSKEKIMSDEINAEVIENTKDPKEQAFLNALHQRNVVADAVKNGTLSCLPGADGLADTKPAVNLVNCTFYHGATLLYLKEVQQKKGYPTAEWASIEQIQKAREENPAIAIRQGQHGVTLNISEKIEGTSDQFENKTIKLFNVAQTVKPNELKVWAEQKQQEKLQEKLEYLRSQYGSNYELPSVKEKSPGPEITCSSTEPKEYLGQYLAAVSMGGQFKASPEQAKEFSQKMEGELYKGIGKISEKTGQEFTDPFSLSKIGNAASVYCKDYMKSLNMEARKQSQEQKNEQKHSRSR